MKQRRIWNGASRVPSKGDPGRNRRGLLASLPNQGGPELMMTTLSRTVQYLFIAAQRAET